MSHQQSLAERFEELEAGRILGDLDASEQLEWKKLSSEFGASSHRGDFFEAIAANLDAPTGDIELPEGMKEKLKADAALFEKQQATHAARPVSFRSILASPLTGWIAAIAVGGWFLLTNFTSDKREATGASNRDLLVENATDLEQIAFAGKDKFAGMNGEVVWSSQRQEGYLTLTGLPANNPVQNQYQLWIVDPTRDRYPVDGGVFDITQGDETIVLPIRNPVLVNQPKAFVITLEQPGGVVVSKQEIVVAVAAPS